VGGGEKIQHFSFHELSKEREKKGSSWFPLSAKKERQCKEKKKGKKKVGHEIILSLFGKREGRTETLLRVPSSKKRRPEKKKK